VDVLVGLAAVAAVAGVGTAWTFVARKNKADKAAEGDTALKRRLGVTDMDESRRHLREKAAERARAKVAAAQGELGVLIDEGRALLERVERWRESDEPTWRQDFSDFSERLRDAAHAQLPPGAAVTIDVECKAVRRASWPAFVSLTETAPGKLAFERGAIIPAMAVLISTFAAAVQAMTEAALSAAQPEAASEEIEMLVDDARRVLQEIARNALLTEYELWSMVHEWRDKMRGVLAQQGEARAAEYISGAPPSKKIPFGASVSSMVPGQLQPMRQLAGWLERLDLWRREGLPAAR
jgi:hypothetical protein